MDQIILSNISFALKKAGKKGLYFRELLARCNISPKRRAELKKCIAFLESKNKIVDTGEKIYDLSFLDLKKGIVSRLQKTFGFIESEEDGTEYFIPGKFFIGALPGDEVLFSQIESRGDLPEGQIIKIIKEADRAFCGTIIKEGRLFYLRPDNLIKYDFLIRKENLKNVKDGDKVLFKITRRGLSHSEHKIQIISSFGSSLKAKNCVNAILKANDVRTEFPKIVTLLAQEKDKQGISAKEIGSRTDLRDEIIFTIDGADTKDIDDAISTRQVGDDYELSVHIADVSYYVTPQSEIEKEAFLRGTSIYFADSVIPMLPKALSNGICSLNENEDRLAFSCIMFISKDGDLLDFKFEKTVIRSVVKGVYSEINKIFSQTADDKILDKYHKVLDSLKIMHKLAATLSKNKRERGVTELETSEGKILFDEDGEISDIIRRTRGESEEMIEEFMLMANQAAATAARMNDVPFVYRVHESPSLTKIEALSEVLKTLAISTKSLGNNVSSKTLADILENSKDKPYYSIINNAILRTMSKAKYDPVPIGHYGLVLENYAQFTSPIRRYPDLVIHRILSDMCANVPINKIKAKYAKTVIKASEQSSKTELAAMKIERMCDDCYKAEYMSRYIGEEFTGIISSIAPQGLYVELDNTVEGLIKTSDLGHGDYDFSSPMVCRNIYTNKKYKVGDIIKVKCVACDVSAGNIDFIKAEAD